MAEKLNIVGKTFAGYAVEKRIGAGGMGVVFRALDERLGRTVALKILPPNLVQDETTRQRFLREGRTAARIDHANVVRLLAAGEDQGYPYLVMEYVDGGTLQQRMDRFKRLPAAETIAIGRQIAGALGAAHKAGILHRDIKPANVLFTREGEAKLADFGLAREENTNVSISVTGMVMGTPHFMAPEVCEGKKADPRSDLYSLGVMMYYLVSGRYPFDSPAIMEVLMAHVQEVAPPLTEAPQALAAVVDCLMAKDPGARLQTADEVIAALDEAGRNPGQPGSVSAARSAAPGSAVSGSGSRLVSVSGSSSTAAAASPGATVPVPAAGVSMVGPLPRTHLLAYAVAGVTILVSTVLLTWAFTIQKTGGPAATPGPGGGGGKAEIPPDPDLLRKGEEFRRWQAFAERVRAPGADPEEALGELEAFAVDEEEKKGLRDDLYAKLKERLESELLARERTLVSLVATDPDEAASRAKGRTDWPAYPFLKELVESEGRTESRVWDAILEKTRSEVGRLEEKGEYRAALEAWDRIRPPFPDKRATIQGEKSGVEFRAKQRADAAVKEAPSGRPGAEALRAVAAKMPARIAEELENIAFLRERADASGGPLEQLRGLILERDFAGLMRQLEHLEKTGQGVDRARLDAAKRLTASAQRVVHDAMEEYRRLADAKADVEIERTDLTTVKGQMFEVADDDSEIRLAVASGVQPIRLASIRAWELARRSLGPNPPDDRLGQALDFAIMMNERPLAFECARAYLRRGLTFLPHQEQGLTAMVAPEDLKEAETLQGQIERDLAAGGAHDAGLARRYLDRFGPLPLQLRDRKRAEHLLALGGGTPDAKDLGRLLAVRTADAGGGQVQLVWPGTDVLLEDFWITGKASVESGEGLRISPVDPQAFLVLEGLRFGRVTVRVELKCDRGTKVGLITGWRTPFDGIGTHFVLETTPAESGASYPVGEGISPVNSSTDGWHTLEITAAESAYSVTVNGLQKKMALPVSWEGQVALVLTGPATIREIRVTGAPRWEEFDLDAVGKTIEEELRAGKGGAVPAGSWLKASSKEAEAAVEAGREPVFFRPQRWAGGSDWMVSFTARLDGEGTREAWPQIFLDCRTASKQARRFVLAGDGRNGFVSKEGWMRTGFCSEFTTGRDHEVVMLVKGEHGLMLIDGKVAWVGVMGPAVAGGPAIGVRSGKLTVRDLHVRTIDK